MLKPPWTLGLVVHHTFRGQFISESVKDACKSWAVHNLHSCT